MKIKNVKNKIIILSFIMILVFYVPAFADWVRTDKGYMYSNNMTGQYVYNNWLQTGNGYYYFDHNGLTVTGWYYIGDSYYYFNQDGIMQTGFFEDAGKTYYLDTQSGKMVTGWIQVYNNGITDYYYFDSNGAMCKGWTKISEKWYYFNEGKALVDTWAEINSIWYHFNVAGSMDTGWITSNGKMYYLNTSNGSLTKGWVQDQNGNEYYLSDNDGSLIINQSIMIGGINYIFDATGKCISKSQMIGDINGNVGVGGLGASNGYYGVSVGVAPGSQLAGTNNITSAQQQVQNQNSVQVGVTTAPR